MASPWDGERMVPRPEDCPVAAVPFRKDLVRRTAWLEYAALRITQRFLGGLPAPLQDPLLAGLARLGRAVDHRHAKPARDFIRTALPGATDRDVERLVLQAYRHLARVAVESDRLPGLVGARLGDHYDVETCAGLEELVGSGRGCIVLTAHVGFWEGVGLPMLALGYRMGVAVGKPPNNPYLARYIQRSREAQGAVLLPRDGALAGVSATVRAGGIAVLLLDQRPRAKPVQVEFFGRPAACDRAAAVLVRRVGAPILVTGCYLTPERRRYRLVFQSVIRPEELAGASPRQVIARVNREIEALVLRCPEQYFWLHDRFKGMPPAPRTEA